MPLLGRSAMVFFGLLALAAPVGCLFLWDRVRGPRTAQAIARVGLVLCCELTALLFAGVIVNDYGSFYTSWSELVGRGGARAAVASHDGVQTYHFGAAGKSAPGQMVTRAAPSRVKLRGPVAGPTPMPEPSAPELSASAKSP